MYGPFSGIFLWLFPPPPPPLIVKRLLPILYLLRFNSSGRALVFDVRCRSIKAKVYIFIIIEFLYIYHSGGTFLHTDDLSFFFDKARQRYRVVWNFVQEKSLIEKEHFSEIKKKRFISLTHTRVGSKMNGYFVTQVLNHGINIITICTNFMSNLETRTRIYCKSI